ncbi:unannotated protein [freshwater metagenome]|uniref:Unannotated protein n=1 Tax=freshwater metagenome TaxID=449393 RepID=A0A6J7P1Y5_9ZZZZ
MESRVHHYEWNEEYPYAQQFQQHQDDEPLQGPLCRVGGCRPRNTHGLRTSSHKYQVTSCGETLHQMPSVHVQDDDDDRNVDAFLTSDERHLPQPQLLRHHLHALQSGTQLCGTATFVGRASQGPQAIAHWVNHSNNPANAYVQYDPELTHQK